MLCVLFGADDFVAGLQQYQFAGAAEGTPPGTYTITVTASSGSNTKGQTSL